MCVCVPYDVLALYECKVVKIMNGWMDANHDKHIKNPLSLSEGAVNCFPP